MPATWFWGTPIILEMFLFMICKQVLPPEFRSIQMEIREIWLVLGAPSLLMAAMWRSDPLPATWFWGTPIILQMFLFMICKQVLPPEFRSIQMEIREISIVLAVPSLLMDVMWRLTLMPAT